MRNPGVPLPSLPKVQSSPTRQEYLTASEGPVNQGGNALRRLVIFVDVGSSYPRLAELSNGQIVHLPTGNVSWVNV